jgi:drug/metabolite transporter superfamily protein YnfA
LVVQGCLVVKRCRKIVWHEIIHLLELVILLLVVGIFPNRRGSILALDGGIFVGHRGASLVFVMLVVGSGRLVGR